MNEIRSGTVAVLGVFDGVHRGHQTLFRKAVVRARRLNLPSVAVTFDPHPAAVLHPKLKLCMLLSLHQRLGYIRAAGIDRVVVIPFTRAFSRWPARRFVQSVLIGALHIKELVVGHDFRFGYDRAGNAALLARQGREHGFKTWVVAPVRSGGRRVSSRAIREWIAAGDLFRARRALGRAPSVVGKVVHGDQRGRQIGFATANLRIEAGVLPPNGVYAARILLGGRRYRAMVNIGVRPTFSKKEIHPRLEAHLLDFKASLYGRRLELEFVKRLRDEKKFASAEALAAQLKRDAARTRRYI